MKKHIHKIITVVVVSLLSLSSVYADELAKVKSDNEFNFAQSGAYPPFNFVNERGELDGFDVDIGKEIARRIGATGKPLATAWSGIIAGLLVNKYDAIIGSMSITKERLKSVNFSDAYYRSGAQLFVGRKSTVKNINDLKGSKIGVTLGTTYESWVRKNVPESTVVTYKGVPDMLIETSNGRIKGFITDKLVGLIAINEKDIPIKLAGGLLYPELIGIATQKSDTQLLKAINKALSAMKKDGTYAKISKKWFKVDIR